MKRKQKYDPPGPLLDVYDIEASYCQGQVLKLHPKNMGERVDHIWTCVITPKEACIIKKPNAVIYKKH